MIYIEKMTADVIIGGPNFKKLGDPYEFVVLAQVREINGEKKVFFTRMSGKFTRKDFKEIINYFNSIGVYNAEWIRIKKGNIKNVSIIDKIKTIILILIFLWGK